MGAVKVKLNSAGVRSLLRSKEVAADLERRAKKIAEAADSAARDPEGHRVTMFTGRNRVRAEIATATPKSMGEEATNRSLSRSLDAGRD